MALQNGDRLGRYTIAAMLGRGGMGTVYRARDTELSRDVALKVIAETADDASRARFRREARSACSFTHPNAATVFDVGTSDGRPFLVMELVDGHALRNYVNDENVPLEQKVAWLLQAAKALAAAHRVGLVHRDVKPDNVLVAANGEAKLVDFGIARTADRIDASAPTAEVDGAVLTATGAIIGSPAYMPPEQLRGQEIDGRSDQFSWGVMAFELLLGHRPWPPAASAFELATSIVLGPPVEVKELEASSPIMAQVVRRSLSRDPNERFASMDDLVLAIEGRTSVALVAPPPSGALAVVSAGPVSAATAPPGTATAPPSSSRTSFLIVAGLVASGAVAVVAVVLAARRDARQAPPAPSVSATATAPSASASTSSAAPPPVPSIRECAEQTGCSDQNKAWCGPTGTRVACCLAGLVGTPKGRCECAPGGSKNSVAVERGCKAAPAEGAPAIQAAVRAEFPKFRRCFEDRSNKSPSLKGKIAVGFHVAPDGTPYEIELKGVSIPDAAFQDCVIDTFARMKLPPPPDGHITVVYPIAFSANDEEVNE